MSFIKNWMRADIQSISPYIVPKANDMIKLDAMESPFSLSNDLNNKYLTLLKNTNINRYPIADNTELKKTLSQLMNIPNDFGILLGNGSDELIQLLCLACNPKDYILSFEPSFVMYKIIAKLTHLNYLEINLTKNFEIDLESTLKSIKKYNPKLIFISNPNNPTGNQFKRKHIETIINSTNAMVVIDEAYYTYTDDNFLNDIYKYQNLILLRTISKIGFAGLRLGLIIGSKSTILELDKLRLPYNINSLTQISADFLLKQKDLINQNTKIINSERIKLSKELQNIKQIKVYPSTTNFILFKTDNANQLFETLKYNKILIKNLSNNKVLKNCLRVTIGSCDENKTFLKIVKEYYDK
jgi:histidinol-phosphate aminotransferase